MIQQNWEKQYVNKFDFVSGIAKSSFAFVVWE